jgi:hypothetical protein
MLETFADERRRKRNRAEVVERDDEAALGGRRRKEIRLQRKLKFVQSAAHRSRELVRARTACPRRVREERLDAGSQVDHPPHPLLSVSAAAPFVATNDGGFAADAALPSTVNRSNFRTAVVDAKAVVDKGDLAAARTRLKDLDKLWDAMASSTPQTVARWRVIDRAIDRGLDRALLALRPHRPNAAMGDEALADLRVAVDQVSGKNQAGAVGGRL